MIPAKQRLVFAVLDTIVFLALFCVVVVVARRW